MQVQNDEVEEDFSKEMLLVPEEEDDLVSLFETLSACSALHPDQDETKDDTVETNDSVERTSVRSNEAVLDHLESVFKVPRT